MLPSLGKILITLGVVFVALGLLFGHDIEITVKGKPKSRSAAKLRVA